MIGKIITSENIPTQLTKRMVKKGISVTNTYKVVCAAFNHHGELLGIVSNTFRNDNVKPARFAGYHAEMRAIHRWGLAIKSMIIMRIGRSGDILPIDCCPKCESVLNKLEIKVFKVRV